MAWTSEDIDKLERAIDASAHIQSMTVGGQQFTFRTIDDMRKLLADMRVTVAGGRTNHRLAATGKGA